MICIVLRMHAMGSVLIEPQSGASIPPETMKDFPLLQNFFRMISQVTPFHVTIPQKYVFSSAKISDVTVFNNRLTLNFKIENQILHFPLLLPQICTYLPLITSPNL